MFNKITQLFTRKRRVRRTGSRNSADIVALVLVSIIALLLLSFYVKGDVANGVEYQHPTDKAVGVGTPFESSSSTSRYVLTEAIVKNNSLTFTEEQAKFASPDIALYNDKFLTVFMPGLSFIGVPFYMIGEQFGLPQLFTYLSVTLFGFLNMFLITRIVFKLGGNIYASFLAGLLFLFGTNALAYSLVFTQHITSVTLLLASILILLSKRTLRSTTLFGALAGIAFLLDVPNLILLTPIGIALLIQHFTLLHQEYGAKLRVNTKFLGILLGVIPFVVLTAWYNFQTTGDYTKIGQNIGQTSYFRDLPEEVKNEPERNDTSRYIPFNPRKLMNGLYTLVVSNERSWLVYSPVVLIGILGLINLYRRKEQQFVANTLVATLLINILTYGMFDDPWGGWAFGPRYLIPGAAILSIGLGIAIQQYKSRIWFAVIFLLVSLYSLFVSSLGALTTSAIPPKVEAVALPTQIPYTYLYNFQFMQANDLSSLLYNMLFSQISGWMYLGALTSVLFVVTFLLYQSAVFYERK